MEKERILNALDPIYIDSKAEEEDLNMTVLFQEWGLTEHDREYDGIKDYKSEKWKNGPYLWKGFKGCEEDIVCVVVSSQGRLNFVET